jgi:4-amino-4-deoxy-L-arabinose transferase-like glycosyltransferase
MLGLLCAGITKVYLYILKEKSIKPALKHLKDPFILTIFLIWLVRGISIIFSKNIQASLLLFGFFTTILALGMFLYLTFRESPQELIKYFKFFSYVVFGLTLFGYFQLYYYYQTGSVIGAMWPVPGKIPRVGSIFWDVNHYGALLAALLPVMEAFFLEEKRIKFKLLDLLMIVSLLGSLLLTNSRTAWMIAGLSFLFFATIVMIKRFGAKGILYIFLAGVMVSTPFVIEYMDKKSDFRRYVRDSFHYRIDSFDSHFMLLTGAYQIFEKYPYLGGGYGSFFEHFSKTDIAPEFFTRDTAALSNRVPAHTIWGESLSETGIFGTVPLVLFSLFTVISPLYLFFKSEDKKTKMMGGVISSAVFGWYAAGIFYSYNSEFFWILIFTYFIWSIGTIGKDWLKKVINYFFSNSEILLSIIAIISALLIFTGLGRNHLIPWDEAIYAKVAKNMVVNNEYIIPRWDSMITGWFEKPPLYMWMMSGFMQILGFNSWAARLPSAIFGFATIVLVYLMGKKMFNKTVAFISSLAITTTIQFLYYSRASMLDVTATFFITLALYLYWQAKKSEGIYKWIFSGISTGLAVMTKGFVGLLPFLVIGLYEISLYLFYKQKISRKLVFNYILTFVSFMLIALPWHLTMYRMFGNAFLDKYFFYHVWDRATTAIEDKGNPFFWYVIVLKVSMRIWFVALLGALPFSLFRSFKKDKKYLFLSIWSVSIFLFFSVAKSKLVWYITPIYPALVLIVGTFSERILNFLMERIKILNNSKFKFLSLYLLLSFSLFYLFLNRKMVYTSDLNGPQAQLLMLKDEVFGEERLVFLDRMEIPTPLFYTNGPFVTTDVNVNNPERFLMISKNEPLIFISKKGRYEETVPGYTNKSKVVKEIDPWVLWYVPPEEGEFITEGADL